MNNKRNCSNCRNYNKQKIFKLSSDFLHWCNIKHCYISRPNEYFCPYHEFTWIRKVLIRLLSVRGMMGR